MNGEVIQLSYGENKNQFGQLRLPNGSGPHPVAIVIHGGFWKARVGLDRMEAIADDLTKRGIATWNIEYRRVGQDGGGFPGTFHDVAAAADLLNELAQQYPLNIQRVITVGHSAGGHLALWLAARHKTTFHRLLNIEHPLSLHGAVSISGANDLSMLHDIYKTKSNVFHQEDNPVYDLLQASPVVAPQIYAETSPLQMLPLGVKQVIIQGALDIIIPSGLNQHYTREAQKAGDDVTYIEFPKEEHFQIVDTTSETWEEIAKQIVTLFD